MQIEDLKKDIVYLLNHYESGQETMKKISEDLRIDLITNYKDYDISFNVLSKLIASLNIDQYKIIMLNTYEKELSEMDKYIIINSIEDENLKKDIIDNNKYNLDCESISKITSSIKDEDFKIKIMSQYTKTNKLDKDVANILKSFGKEKIMQIVLNYKEYGLSAYSIVLGIENLDKESRMKIFDKLYVDGILGDNKEVKLIKTDKDLTFGIEIEFEGQLYKNIKGSDIDKYWIDKNDVSLTCGKELVSPIMRSGLNFENQIYKACGIIDAHNCHESELTAGHVHFGADYFENNVEYYKTFINLYRKVERILFLISNKENTTPREAIYVNAALLGEEIEKLEKQGIIDIESATTVEEFLREIRKAQISRYYSINFNNVGNSAKNTIEFRMANSSLDPDVWVENINLFGGIMKAAKDITDLKEKKENGEFINKEDLLKLDIYDLLMKNELSEEERLAMIMLFSVPQEDRKIYTQRYTANNSLLKEGTLLENFLDDTGKPKMPIRLRD